MKKTIIAISFILIIFVISLFAYKINYKLSKEEFVSLMRKFEDVSNVKIEGSSTKYIKDGLMITIVNNGVDVYTWSNAETKECIKYIPREKLYTYIEYEESEYTDLYNLQYTFKGYKKYNGTKCAVGEFKLSDEWTTEIWLDAKKGTCLKTVNSIMDLNGEKEEIEEQYTAIYGVVKEEEVKRPDLTGYTEMKSND